MQQKKKKNIATILLYNLILSLELYLKVAKGSAKKLGKVCIGVCVKC